MGKLFVTFLILLFLFIQHALLAQDRIVLKHGQEIQAKVLEVSRSQIKYKKESNPEGPVYIEKKYRIERIVYQNGDIDEFANQYSKESLNRSSISYHFFDVVHSDITLSFEHIVESGKYGIKIPVAIGYDLDSYRRKNFAIIAYTGIGVNIYPAGQHTFSYFIGPEFHIGYGTREYDDFTTSTDDNGHHVYNHFRVQQYFFFGRMLINNGVSFTAFENLKFSAVFGFGARYLDVPKFGYSGLRSTIHYTLGMGYAF